MKPGDRFKYKDKAGSGHIVQCIDKKKVLVFDEIVGFEIEVQSHEIILIEKFHQRPSIPIEATSVNTNISKSIAVSKYEKETNIEEEKPEDIEEGLHLGIQKINRDGNWVLTLFNQTAYSYYFAISTWFEDSYQFITHDFIAASNLLEVTTYNNAEANDLKEIVLQAIVVGNGTHDGVDVVNNLYKISSKKLVSSGNYKIVNQCNVPVLLLKPNEKKNRLPSSIPSNTNIQILAKKPTIGYDIRVKTKEVDLHIEKLVSDFKKYSNAELMDIQLKKVFSVMDECLMSKDVLEVIFIHGVGEGKLKNEVRFVLRQYSNITVSDADYEKYGFGATKVKFC